MISVKVIGSDGKELSIGSDGDIPVIVHDHPPLHETRQPLPFRQYFTLDGTPNGDNNMRVDGSATSIEFCIPSNQNEDLFIKSIAVKLADASAKLDKFGALSALTNGVEFEWQNQSRGAIVIHEGIKDNLEFFRMSSVTPLITDLSGGGADAIIVPIDLTNMFGTQWGVKLTKGTTEKLIFRINDNLGTGLDEFNIIGHGIKV